MPKKEINIPIGTIVGQNTEGTFEVVNIFNTSQTEKIWAEMGKAPPHDPGYQIRFKCGKTYYTLKTQVWKCMSPNDVGWRACYKCKKTCNESCRWDQQVSHKISVTPLREVELQPGKVFGNLKLIDFAFNAKRHNYYEFEGINCGAHMFHMTPTNKSDIDACHCPQCTDHQISKGESRIANYLNEHQISYQRQYKFEDCRNKNLLPFDFAILYPTKELKCLIEYDGEQHYKFVKHWHGDEEGFKLQQLRDNIKTEYCKKHNIKLIRIPFTDYDNIEEILKLNSIY